MTILEEKLALYAKHSLNVLMLGYHGIGKTTVCMNIAKQLNLNFKYYSASTLDPFADIVGIPVPDKEKGTLEFYRPKDLENAEFLLFDELNRAHPRVLNAILEIVQFKRVNGIPLPNLKMVWAAMNPPGENYQVEELDPALVDRFHCYISMPSELHLPYLSSVLGPDIANLMKAWWETKLDESQRRVFTPRRVEYVGKMIKLDLPWRDSIPQGHAFPLDDLQKAIKKLKHNVDVIDDDLAPTKENILAKTTYFIKKVKESSRLYPILANVLKGFDEDDYFAVRDLLELLPIDLVHGVLDKKFSATIEALRENFAKNNIDIKKYPNLSKICKWDKETL